MNSNIKKALLCALAALLPFGMNAVAGDKTGNGGDAIVCYNQAVDEHGRPLSTSKLPLEILKVNLYDFWEWSQKSNLPLALGPASLSYRDKFKLLADAITPVDPWIGNLLSEAHQSDFSDIAFATHGSISEINDSHDDLGYRDFCYKRQIARQKKDVRYGEKRIIIDRGLFERLSEDERALLLSHEYIYTVALQHGAENSDLLRHYNFMISADSAVLQSADDYRKIAPEIYGYDAPAYFYLFDHETQLAEMGLEIPNISIARSNGLSYRYTLKGRAKIQLPDGPVSVNELSIRADAKPENQPDVVQLGGLVGTFKKSIRHVGDHADGNTILSGSCSAVGTTSGCIVNFDAGWLFKDGELRAEFIYDDGQKVGPFVVGAEERLITLTVPKGSAPMKLRLGYFALKDPSIEVTADGRDCTLSFTKDVILKGILDRGNNSSAYAQKLSRCGVRMTYMGGLLQSQDFSIQSLLSSGKDRTISDFTFSKGTLQVESGQEPYFRTSLDDLTAFAEGRGRWHASTIYWDFVVTFNGFYLGDRGEFKEPNLVSYTLSGESKPVLLRSPNVTLQLLEYKPAGNYSRIFYEAVGDDGFRIYTDAKKVVLSIDGKEVTLKRGRSIEVNATQGLVR